MSISVLIRSPVRFWQGRVSRSARPGATLLSDHNPEVLEPRWLPSISGVTPPAIQMISATTTDSKSVTVEYQVNQPPGSANPIQFGVYRSSNGLFNASDSLVDTITLVSPSNTAGEGTVTLDQNGQAATGVGLHQLTIPLSQGLPPFPEKPYVLVVADPSAPTATNDPEQAASFRTYTIGIVTHGGIQDPSWTHGPPWEIETAYMMRHEGYDAVIAYNWAEKSSTPGEAIKQSPKLAALILAVADKFPASDPVDLDFIGHSEGTVINTYAMAKLEHEMTPQLKAGFIEDTLLDPHAANENVPGQQMSFNGPLAGLASLIVNDYQAEANDPPVFIPPIVDEAQVFFEHSQASSSAIYNLWGQVPVKTYGPIVHYYNLTDMGVTHSGKTGVNYWFRDFVAPTLGDQAPLITQLQLNGQIDNTVAPTSTNETRAASKQTQLNRWEARANRVYGPEHVVPTSQPYFSGTAAPGSLVRLAIGPATKPGNTSLRGVTTANSNGQWSLTTRHPLRNGQYRVVVAAFSRALRTRPGLAIVPTQPLGRLVVDASPKAPGTKILPSSRV
jgi:hypothetical protein